jgi:hypothetical protein
MAGTEEEKICPKVFNLFEGGRAVVTPQKERCKQQTLEHCQYVSSANLEQYTVALPEKSREWRAFQIYSDSGC